MKFRNIFYLMIISFAFFLVFMYFSPVSNCGCGGRGTGLKTDFKTYQDSAYLYMIETNADDLHYKNLNTYLDEHMQIDDNGIVVNNTFTTTTKKLDPWGKPYDVLVNDDKKKIVFQSWGKSELRVNPDFIMGVYFNEGEVDRCVVGFDTRNISFEKFDTPDDWSCGEDLIIQK